MSEENSHVSVKPSESVSKEAEKRVESKSGRKGEPEFHLTEQMRRLSTPWGIALARARQIDTPRCRQPAHLLCQMEHLGVLL